MLGNVLANPAEPKYRKVRTANPNFNTKVYSSRGAPELFRLVGFKEADEGFIVLAEGSDLALLHKAVDALTALADTRRAADEKKRKLLQQKEAEARLARVQKASELAVPAQFDAAVSANSQLMAG